MSQSLSHTYRRYRTLQTHRITAMPLAILMPHSACNCRCVMCDIWKGNRNLKQLHPEDIQALLASFEKLGTQQVLMSGGEALLNPLFFDLCRLLKEKGLRIALLSTGMTLSQHASNIVKWVDELIVSLDGDATLHDRIRNIPGAFAKMKEGIANIRAIAPHYRITGRSVIHRLNFQHWPAIIDSAHELELDQISFLPADVSSNAFNRETAWDADRQNDIQLGVSDLAELQSITQYILHRYQNYFTERFIAESPEKIQKITDYYSALHGLQDFPYKKCNAPWVSAVVEAGGEVRPCFFHKIIGNIREQSLDAIVNSPEATGFRKELDMSQNETCTRCVCYLHLSPGVSLS